MLVVLPDKVHRVGPVVVEDDRIKGELKDACIFVPKGIYGFAAPCFFPIHIINKCKGARLREDKQFVVIFVATAPCSLQVVGTDVAIVEVGDGKFFNRIVVGAGGEGEDGGNSQQEEGKKIFHYFKV